MSQARQLTGQFGDSSATGSATLDRDGAQNASAGNDFASHFMPKARELTGQRFGGSNFSMVSSPERNTVKTSQKDEHGEECA